MSFSRALTEQSLRLLKLYEEDEPDVGTRTDLRPHQHAASIAHQSSVHADELSRKHHYGQIGDEDAFEVRDAHKQAHDNHVAAAQSLIAAGHHGLAQDHIALAKQHAGAAAKYHEIHKKAFSDPDAHAAATRLHGIKTGAKMATAKNVQKGARLAKKSPLSPKLSVASAAAKAKSDREAGHQRGIRAMQGMAPKKAVGESVEPSDRFVTEQRRLMGFNGYSSLAESVTLQKLDQFESDIQSWRYRQRDLMGLESHYPQLREVYEPPSEDEAFAASGSNMVNSQGLADVNYQVMADQAERASMKATELGRPGAHLAAAQAQMAAARMAPSKKGRVEHEALAAHHEYHAHRSPQTKIAQVRQRVDGGPVIGVPTEIIQGRARIGPTTNGTSVGESIEEDKVPMSVRLQARAIERSGGLKKRPGGAKSKAGIAYAIAWKHHNKKEDKQSDAVLAKLDKKKSTSDTAMDTLAKLRKKHGMEHKEDAQSDKVLAKLGKKHGTHDAALDALAKLRKKHGMEHREDHDDGSRGAPASPHPPLAGSAGVPYEDIDDMALMAAVDEAWNTAYGSAAE